MSAVAFPFGALFRKTALKPTVALGIGYVLVAGFFLRQYLLWDPQWVLGLALLPFITLPAIKRKSSPFLLIGLVCLLLMAAFYKITTLYFFALLLAFWVFLQTVMGRSGGYALLMLAVASPIFRYVSEILSFPLRLQLTKAAAVLLSVSYTKVEAVGNLLLLDGEEFSVDPACAGLHMLSFSLMIGVFLLAHLHRTQHKPWPLWQLTVLLAAMLLLNLGANLLRILVLVILRIGPEDLMHDAVGLICLVLYALLPFYLLVKFTKNRSRFKADFPKEASKQENPSKETVTLHLLLLLCLAGVGYQVQTDRKSPQLTSRQTIPGFEKTILQDGVTKFTNGQALVYMKPVRAFYSTEHHPMICWEGSGYQFKHVSEKQVNGKIIFTGILEKGQDRLHTAWWMDNGRHQTISQADWRWRMARGEPAFHLVNVTASTEALLVAQVGELN
ncbi:exosortase N [Rufibacter sediminis]|uniref:Exosortase N n=1 Tax=Rufibacter sediminis TaxID=2762756 RepID=A0ABR6VLX8_9BACT|nr:exosortase N [Rufibacter sediminis]MBC3538231.1 exosortase N [Rufibacter sediminis]